MLELTAQQKNPLFAIQCLLKGFQWLMRKELRKYFLLPLLINILLYSGLFALGYFYLTDLINSLIPDWLSWLEWLLWPLFFISFLVTGFFTFTLVANLIASPFYSHLAARTEELLSGDKVDIEELPMLKVLLAEMKRIGYLLSRMLPLLLLFVIPVVNLIAPLLWALFGAWGCALEYMAYPLENKGLLFSEQRQLLQQSRLSVLIFGGIVVLGITVPVVNLLMAPAAVIAATVFFYGANNAVNGKQASK